MFRLGTRGWNGSRSRRSLTGSGWTRERRYNRRRLRDMDRQSPPGAAACGLGLRLLGARGPVFDTARRQAALLGPQPELPAAAAGGRRRRLAPGAGTGGRCLCLRRCGGSGAG